MEKFWSSAFWISCLFSFCMKISFAAQERSVETQFASGECRNDTVSLSIYRGSKGIDSSFLASLPKDIIDAESELDEKRREFEIARANRGWFGQTNEQKAKVSLLKDEISKLEDAQNKRVNRFIVEDQKRKTNGQINKETEVVRSEIIENINRLVKDKKNKLEMIKAIEKKKLDIPDRWFHRSKEKKRRTELREQYDAEMGNLRDQIRKIDEQIRQLSGTINRN
ncbi:MAG: hypothetical protein HQK53_09605 [Oligoflexia bacterium]|nr:hypothetical protein [Oligoflexia bacterium]